jgi:hypothetical protein
VAASRSSRSGTASAASSGVVRQRPEGPAVPLDPEQRSRLLATKARALVADHLGVDPAGDDAELRPGAFPGGATVRAGSSGWVLVDERPERGLGPALIWADREGLDGLHVVVEDPSAAGLLARRATAFARTPTVWRAEGRALVPADPAPHPAPVEPPAVAREAAGLLHEAGVEVTVEHGEIRGEIRGLEVARVVVADDGTARIEVGVGRHDREAFALVHGDLPTADALASVVRSVGTWRRPEAEAHPLRHLVPERWLRWRLMSEPGLLGLAELHPAEPVVPRGSVKDSGAAVAHGRDAEGRTVVVACSVGVDLDLVPTAADARLAIDPTARLLVVLPERDDLPVTRRLVAALTEPAEIVPLAGDWRASGRPTGEGAP